MAHSLRGHSQQLDMWIMATDWPRHEGRRSRLRQTVVLPVPGGLALSPGTGDSWVVATAAPTVGLHEDSESIVSALVARARTVTGMDIASAAVRDASGDFPMTVYRGVQSEAFQSLTIKA